MRGVLLGSQCEELALKRNSLVTEVAHERRRFLAGRGALAQFFGRIEKWIIGNPVFEVFAFGNLSKFAHFLMQPRFPGRSRWLTPKLFSRQPVEFQMAQTFGDVAADESVFLTCRTYTNEDGHKAECDCDNLCNHHGGLLRREAQLNARSNDGDSSHACGNFCIPLVVALMFDGCGIGLLKRRDKNLRDFFECELKARKRSKN